MTQITKEQAYAALGAVEQFCVNDYMLDPQRFCIIRSYITQLEANQRQPVSDEKLKDIISQANYQKSVGADILLLPENLETIKSALSELEKLRAESKWQPIESAPRDGREHIRINVLVYHLPSKMTAVAYCNHYGEWRYIDGAEIHVPTHWMPLPTPPAQEVK